MKTYKISYLLKFRNHLINACWVPIQEKARQGLNHTQTLQFLTSTEILAKEYNHNRRQTSMKLDLKEEFNSSKASVSPHAKVH